MNRTFYVIIGPDDEGLNQQYWDVGEWEWTADFEQATRFFTSNVFFMPPPPGASCIIEFTEENKPVRQLDFDSPPPYGVSPFAL